MAQVIGWYGTQLHCVQIVSHDGDFVCLLLVFLLLLVLVLVLVVVVCLVVVVSIVATVMCAPIQPTE